MNNPPNIPVMNILGDRSEMSTFSTWLGKALQSLDERERSLGSLHRSDSTKEFVSDVIAHQADLRFITMAAQKFIDESKVSLLSCRNIPNYFPSLHSEGAVGVKNL
jgi:dystonin